MITIRPIEAGDESAWAKLFAGDGGYLESCQQTVSQDVVESTFKRFLDPNFEMWSAVAVDDDNDIVGFVDYLSHYHTWAVEPEVYLNDLFVRADARLQRCGQKLIQFVYDHADKMGTPKVYWCTQFDNYKAQILYTKMGEDMKLKLYKRPNF